MNTYPCAELISTVCIRYSVTVSNDLSVIVIESQIFKCITIQIALGIVISAIAINLV